MGKVERGEHMPTLALILKISRALNVSAGGLMTGTKKRLQPSDRPNATTFCYKNAKTRNTCR